MENLNAMKGGALLYPARDWSLRPSQGQSRDYEQQRLGVLGHMLEGEYRVVVCSVEAAMQLTLPPEELYTRTVTLKAGEDCTPEAVVESLLAAGYARAERWTALANSPGAAGSSIFPAGRGRPPARGILGRFD